MPACVAATRLIMVPMVLPNSAQFMPIRWSLETVDVIKPEQKLTVMALHTAITNVPMIKPSLDLTSVTVALRKWMQTVTALLIAMIHAKMK